MSGAGRVSVATLHAVHRQPDARRDATTGPLSASAQVSGQSGTLQRLVCTPRGGGPFLRQHLQLDPAAGSTDATPSGSRRTQSRLSSDGGAALSNEIETRLREL